VVGGIDVEVLAVDHVAIGPDAEEDMGVWLIELE
jgi:hypothetical protein